MEIDYKKQFKDICKKYNFKYREYSENKIALCAKNTDRQWRDWIELDLKKKIKLHYVQKIQIDIGKIGLN